MLNNDDASRYFLHSRKDREMMRLINKIPLEKHIVDLSKCMETHREDL